MRTTTVEVWVAVGADGDTEVHTSPEDAEGHGLICPVRMVRVKVEVPLPKVVEVAVKVAAETDEATVDAA